MKSMYGLAVGKVLVIAAVIFVTLTVSGCIDPVEADMQAEHRNLSIACEQDLLLRGVSGFSSAAHAPMFRPSP